MTDQQPGDAISFKPHQPNRLRQPTREVNAWTYIVAFVVHGVTSFSKALLPAVRRKRLMTASANRPPSHLALACLLACLHRFFIFHKEKTRKIEKNPETQKRAKKVWPSPVTEAERPSFFSNGTRRNSRRSHRICAGHGIDCYASLCPEQKEAQI